MNFENHSSSEVFDWKGFVFFLKVATLALLLTFGGRFSYSYYIHNSSPKIEPGPITIAPENTPPGKQFIAIKKSSLSTSTPVRIINALTIDDVIPSEGKFIAADLVNMKLHLFKDGTEVDSYTIKSKGRPGTPWETPSGVYSIETKEPNHFSSIGKVYMPYSMQFYGNYFIHGWTYYPDGSPTSASFSGGCIKLSTSDAQKVFAFADVKTKVFVYDSKNTTSLPPLSLASATIPEVEAPAYLIADIDTGDVYAEQNAQEKRPIASVTKLMTALVANEVISLNNAVTVNEGSLYNPPKEENKNQKVFLVNDLFYPLLMQSSNGVADALASYYGKSGFISWMNSTAKALDMTSTTYADASGVSAENISTADDQFRLASYLINKKSFVFNITHTTDKSISSLDGSKYAVTNVNGPSFTEPFIGGKVGHTTAALDTNVSILSLKVGETTRRIAVIVLGSTNQIQDTNSLAEWITKASTNSLSQPACASCSTPTEKRKIDI